MGKQTLAVLLGAAVLFAIVLVAALAFTGTGPGGDAVHTMPDGRTMTGGAGDMGTVQGGQAMPGMAPPSSPSP